MEKFSRQYFSRYAETEVQLLDSFPTLTFDEAVCVPAFNEEPLFLTSLNCSAIKQNINALVILVINQPEDTEPSEQNLILFNQLTQYSLLWKNQHLALLQYSDNLHILLVDRFNNAPQIPKKQGVGLARKIACDMGAFLQQKSVINSSQLFSSDADVIFPSNYFSAKLNDCHSAMVFDFIHSPSGNNEVDKATQLYDKSLHHYVEGLQNAGSSYAFHTIGSCLLVDIESYIKVRGFPKRAGGEDFYLLNKLNKIKPVSSTTNISLNIQSRLSDRAPFGTGPAVQKIVAGDNQLFYHPLCFDALQAWLGFLNEISLLEDMADIKNTLKNSEPTLIEISNEFQLITTVEKLWKNFKTAQERRRQIHHWFDAFKTLKLIHSLTYTQYKKISVQELT